jgi:hypothetical protein
MHRKAALLGVLMFALMSTTTKAEVVTMVCAGAGLRCDLDFSTTTLTCHEEVANASEQRQHTFDMVLGTKRPFTADENYIYWQWTITGASWRYRLNRRTLELGELFVGVSDNWLTYSCEFYKRQL